MASFRITVLSTPVSGETNSVVSGQSAQVQVEALDSFGGTIPGYRGTVHFSTLDTQATLPADYTFTAADAGSHAFSLTLKTVFGSLATRDITVQDVGTGVSSIQRIFVWFQVRMDVERWQNCDFNGCPNPGSYNCQTSCNPNGFASPAQFVAVTQSGLCNRGIVLKAQQPGGAWASAATTIQDCGPRTCSNPYWSTGTVPTVGGCLTDLLATNLGIPNGCNGSVPFGTATIQWRFQ